MPSTVIRSFRYLPEARELLVEFVTGRRYVYCEVPEDEAAAMARAFGKGRYFNAHIRDAYAFREVDPEGD